MRRAFGSAMTLAAATFAACFSTPREQLRVDGAVDSAGSGDTSGTADAPPGDGPIGSGSCTTVTFTNGTDCGSWAIEGTAGGADAFQQANVLDLQVGSGSAASTVSCTSAQRAITSVTFFLQSAYTSASPTATTFVGASDSVMRIGIRFYDTGSGPTLVSECPNGGNSSAAFGSSPLVVQIRRNGANTEVRAGASTSALNTYGGCAGNTILDSASVLAVVTRGSGGSISTVPSTIQSIEICSQ